MKIRALTENEIPEVSKLAVAAYRDKPIQQWLFPESKISTTGVYKYWANFLKLWHADPNVSVMVAELEPEDDTDETAAGQVCALAIWEFHAPSVESDEASVIEALADTGVDFEALHEFAGFENELESRLYAGTKHWHLTRLCTLESWWKRGAGTALANWGVQKAQEDGVFAAVEATDQSLSLYTKVGFKKLEDREIGPVHIFVCRT